MVNTFVVYEDYRISAKSLDLVRLRKQILEAYQIYDILRCLEEISRIENWSVLPHLSIKHHSSPKIIAQKFTRWVEWTIETRKKYLALSYRYAVIDGELKKFPKSRIPYRIYKNDKYEDNNNGTISIWVLPKDEERILMYSPKKISRDHKYKNRTGYILPRISVSLPGDEVWTLGFSQHAAVKMWSGYLPSLKIYINTHIDEYTSRYTSKGNKCTISLPKLKVDSKNPPVPWWISLTDVVIHSHRASLLRKEFERSENEWYWSTVDMKFPLESKEWMNRGYVWVGSLGENSEKLIVQILKGRPNYSVICAPIRTSVLSQNQLRKKFSYTGEYLIDQDGYVQIHFE